MKLNFFQLLQDSWNFMRNQRQFSLTALIGLAFLQIANYFAFTYRFNSTVNRTPEEMMKLDPYFILSSLIPTFIIGIFSVWFSLLILLNVKAISEGKYQNFFALTSLSFKKLFTTILLTLVMSFPLSFGLASVSLGMGVIAIPLIISGCFLFLKWCLSVNAYVIDDLAGVKAALQYSWQLTKGKLVYVMLFALLLYFLPSIIINQISGNTNALLPALISGVINTFLGLYLVLFSFRFYQTLKTI